MTEAMMREWIVPSSARIAEISGWLLSHKRPDRIMLVVRLHYREERWVPDEIEAVKTTIELLGDGLLDMQVASGWPMTELRGGSALVFLGRFSSELIPRMAALGPCLRDWVHVHEPPLPEDICLFRYGADHPVLVSTTHEGDCLVFSHEDVEIPGVALEEEVDDPIDLSRWLFDRGNHFLRDGRPVLSTAIEVAAGTIRL